MRNALAGLMLLAGSLAAADATAQSNVQWNGFALIRPETPASGVPLDDDALSAQLQIGVDWRPSPSLGAHLHVLARNEADGSRRGRVGVVEAFVEQNILLGENDRIHVMEGAFFLPTSRENIDSLWETPYTITSSALNSWMGEEFRPIGVDGAWRHRIGRGAVTGGATAYIGNDTFGALPVDRGWALRDHWALLGEHLPATSTLYTSVSAETDHRIGWSARGKWNNDRGAIQFTRIDNRSDARRYGELFNWATRFNIAGGDYTWGDWTFVGETGWGTTAIEGRRRVSLPIRASYALLSRRIANFRVSVRADEYRASSETGHAYTAALFWEPVPQLRAGLEGIKAGDEKRVAVEARYRF